MFFSSAMNTSQSMNLAEYGEYTENDSHEINTKSRASKVPRRRRMDLTPKSRLIGHRSHYLENHAKIKLPVYHPTLTEYKRGTR
jgi:hypothetical protein